MKQDTDFRYWCIESDLDEVLHQLFFSLEFSSEDSVIYLSENPQWEYALDVSHRWRCLYEGLASLQVLQTMLKAREYPINIQESTINRHEWFRITHDLILYRFAALRDYALQLTNSVYELNLPAMNVRLKSIKSKIESTGLKTVELLEKISRVGDQLREDRNMLAHEGHFSGLEDEGLDIRKAFSMFEGSYKSKGSFIVNNLSNDDGKTSDEIIEEFQNYYNSKFDKFYVELIKAGDNINQLLNNLCDAIALEFENRFIGKQELS